ncbi:hypothetical protein JGU66_03755 [Myxococcaceae bacterium JPH2]|nr:hypothetical protein [Myxococcaceae bacterium JPH2]
MATSSCSLPRPRWLLAALAMLSLTGCFDMVEDVWLHSDGSARVRVDLSMPRALLPLAQAGGEDPVARVKGRTQAAEGRLKNDPDLSHFELSYAEEGELLHVIYDLTVKDATKLSTLQQRALDVATTEERAQLGGLWGLRIEKPSSGEALFVQRFEPDQSSARVDTDLADAAAKELGHRLALALFADHHVTVRVHGESIGETNGTVNAQKDSVEWKMPLADFVNGNNPGRELRAVVYTGAPAWLWPLVIGVPLATLGLAIASVRRRRAP